MNYNHLFKNLLPSLLRIILIAILAHYNKLGLAVFIAIVVISTIVGTLAKFKNQGYRYYFFIPLQVFFFYLIFALYYQVLEPIFESPKYITGTIYAWTIISGLMAERAIIRSKNIDYDTRELVSKFILPIWYFFVFPFVIMGCILVVMAAVNFIL